MLEEQTIIKSLSNLYELIDKYYSVLQKKEKRNHHDNFERLKTENTELEQQVLDYRVSIYKNIKKKKIPFTQLFDLKINNPYMLNDTETEIIRQYIGIYTEGKKQSIEYLSNIFDITSIEINRIINSILKDFLNPYFQREFLKERNEMIKKNLKNQKLLNKLLDEDIEFLNIYENMIYIFRSKNINTLKDLLNMDFRIIKDINKEYGQDSKKILFPEKIINEIHDLGLDFKNKTYIECTKPFEKTQNEKIKSITNNKIESILDLACAYQFEPEIIKTFNIKERLELDKIMGYLDFKEGYINFIEEIKTEIEDKITKNKVASTIEDLIRHEYPYMFEEDIELYIEDSKKMFEITKQEDEPQYVYKKRFLIDKN